MSIPPGAAADVAVRPANPSDAERISTLLVASWLMGPSAAVTARVAALNVDEVADSWREAISAPPSRHHLTLVATAGSSVVGFLASAPVDGSSDVELLEMVVDSPVRRNGHGSRLLAAWADLMAEEGVAGAITWIAATDRVGRDFLAGAGWGVDGARRTLDLTGEGTELLQQIKLATSLPDR